LAGKLPTPLAGSVITPFHFYYLVNGISVYIYIYIYIYIYVLLITSLDWFKLRGYDYEVTGFIPQSSTVQCPAKLFDPNVLLVGIAQTFARHLKSKIFVWIYLSKTL